MTNLRIWLLLFLCLTLGSGHAADVKVIALFSGKAMLQVGNERKIVSNGETFQGVLLKSASGRGAVVEIDGETMTLGLNQSIAGNFKKPTRNSVRIPADQYGMYFIKGTINGQATNFLVDTGATNVTISGNKAKSLGIDYRKGLEGEAHTANAIVPAWRVQLDAVEIGGILARNVTATVLSGDKPAEVLLGNSFLGRMDLQQAGSVLTIKKRY